MSPGARRLSLLLVCVGGLAACPASALADTSTSANWSGYVAHRAGVSFRRVQASWTQPNATCQEGDATYSAFWVGLGGYSSSSDALEQIGTELDCSASGAITSSAWYQLVPSPMNSIRMTVEPGDLMSASVVVTGHRVTLRLTDHTQHESFSKQITAKSVDTSSADWIAEAPSVCTMTNFCEPLPLTDFGSMSFTAGPSVDHHRIGRTDHKPGLGHREDRTLLGRAGVHRLRDRERVDSIRAPALRHLVPGQLLTKPDRNKPTAVLLTKPAAWPPERHSAARRETPLAAGRQL